MPDVQEAYLSLIEKYDDLKLVFDELSGVVIAQQVSKSSAEDAYDEVTAIIVRHLRISRGTEQCG